MLSPRDDWEFDAAIFVVCVALALLLLSSCSLVSHIATKPPAATITLPTGAKLEQSGTAAKPAQVTTTTATQTLPLPAGTDLTFDQKGNFVLHFALPTTLRTESVTEHAEAPQAFAPPAPPTPSQLADGKARLYYYLGLVVGGAAALFGLVRDYTLLMIGGAAVAGACAVALFVQNYPWLLAVIGFGCALKIAGPTFWHLYIKPQPTAKV